MDSFVLTAVPPVGVFHWDRDVRQSFQTRLGSVLIGCSVGWFFQLRDTLEGLGHCKAKTPILTMEELCTFQTQHRLDLFLCVFVFQWYFEMDQNYSEFCN